MIPASCPSTAPVPPPSYHRALAKRAASLQINALTLVTTLHLLALCRLAVQAAPRSGIVSARMFSGMKALKGSSRRAV
jgi:hypothetical protein